MKLFIGSLLVFSLIILFLFALFPSEITVTRIVHIHRSPEDVLKHIDDLREWKTWNEFVIHSYEAGRANTDQNHGTDSGTIDMGGVHIQLIKLHLDTLFTVWSRGDESFTGNFILVRSDMQTILAWDLKFHIQWYPWKKLASMFYDKNMGPVMEKSLMNLKSELETSSP